MEFNWIVALKVNQLPRYQAWKSPQIYLPLLIDVDLELTRRSGDQNGNLLQTKRSELQSMLINAGETIKVS